MIGRPNIMAKVSRSRRAAAPPWRSWRRAAAGSRAPSAQASSALSRALPIRWMKTSSSVGSASSHLIEGSARQGSMALSSAARSGPQTCSVAPNAAAALTPGASRSLRRQPVGARPAGDEGDEAGLPDDLLRGAARHQLAVGDVGDLVTALGLVHVVGRDQHGDALRGIGMDLVPEGAPRLGIDAGGRLVEQQQPGLVQHAGGQRQPLLPAARQRAGELVLARRQPEPLQRVVDPLLRRGRGRRRGRRIRGSRGW